MKVPFFRKIFIKFSKNKEVLENKKNIKPSRDWEVVVVLFVIINITIFSLHVYMTSHFQNKGSSSREEEKGEKVSAINKNDLDDINSYFSEREDLFRKEDTLKTKRDPSL